jgi:hypothetical protein
MSKWSKLGYEWKAEFMIDGLIYPNKNIYALSWMGVAVGAL